MLKTLNYKIERFILIFHIFRKIVPLYLYHRIFINSIKNTLHFYTPFSAVLGLTYRCQCKCIHCSASYYKIEPNEELTTKEWIILLDEIAALGVPRINFSGGEALLKEDIFTIIRHASKKFITILETNGLILRKGVISELKKSRISCVAVSIDSYIPQLHDQYRGIQGCFDAALRGVNECLKANIPCIISTYIPHGMANERDIKLLMSLAKKSNVMAVRILPPRPVGNFTFHTQSLLTDEDSRIIQQFIDPRLAYFKGIPGPDKCGIFTRNTFYVSPYGEVQPCPYIPIFFGNIRERNIRDILSKMWNHKIFFRSKKSCIILDNDFREKFINPFLNKPLFPIYID